MITNERPDRPIPFRKRRVVRETKLARALLALHWMADDDGLFVRATYAEVAAELGRTAENTKAILTDLRLRGDIAVFTRPQFPVPVTTIVLMDHPDALRAVAELYATRNWDDVPELVPAYVPRWR